MKSNPRGNFRGTRGVRGALSNPRLPPPAANSRSSKPAAPKELSRPDVSVAPMTLFEKYAGTPENPRSSKFGGTDIERCTDNVASEALNFEFDYAQFYIPLTVNGSYTVVDRILLRPKTAVYVDGVQHDIREAAEAKDTLQDMELESEGWLVVRLKDADLRRDPVGTVRGVLYAT